MKTEHKILHLKFARYGANTKEWMRKCILLLPEIARYRIWEQKGFGSIYEYAAKLAGMSHEQVNESLRVLAKIEDKPELQKVVEMKGLNAVKPVVAVATAETAGFWAEKAIQMSKNTLETYVREFRKEHFSDDLPSLINPSTPNDHLDFGLPRKAENAENSQQQGIENFKNEYSVRPKVTIVMHLDPEVADQLEKLKCGLDLNGGRNGVNNGTTESWNELMKQFLKMREEKLEEQKPEPVKTVSRHIPSTIKKFVSARTNGICAYHGCKKANQILHHTQRFALEKVHDSDRLYGLCKAHERIAHLGLIEKEELSPNHWRLRMLPDENQMKFKIDLQVAKFRNFAMSSQLSVR